MTIYAVSRGEGKQLYVAKTKFFVNKEDAEAYRETKTYMGDYHIIRKYDRATNELLFECCFYSGKNVSESDKQIADKNHQVGNWYPYYVKCFWERRPTNNYVVTPIEVF